MDLIIMPFTFGDGKTGNFDSCVKYYQGMKSKKTGKNYTKDEASAVCSVIMRGQEHNSKKDDKESKKINEEDSKDSKKDQKKKEEKKFTHGRFTLSLHQLGNEKHFDLFIEKEGYCEDFAFTPVKSAQKNVLKNGDRAQKRNVVNLNMLDFTGVITVGKPGASKDFPGIMKVLEKGTYDVLEEAGGIFKYNFTGNKLNGTYQFLFDDEKLQENFKYRYIFTQLDEKDELIMALLSQIEEMACPDRTEETLSMKQEVGILHELLKDGKVVPLIIRGTALKEGVWNGIFYPYDEIKRTAMGLIGKPLMTDHEKSVKSIAGKVTGISFDDVNRCVNFEATIIDESTANKVLAGLVDSVSVGVIVDRMKEDMGMTARNYEFKELSLVIDPACKDAKIKEIIPPAEEPEEPETPSIDEKEDELKA
jgi:hypothetical protein